MEVDKISFFPLLLDILTDISTSHFVALDLELSGVPSKQYFTGNNHSGKPSLQQRYLETKQAAERYQILQFGLTCVEQDLENGKYILRPYNFEVSPLIDERWLDIERVISFQSSAVEFLLKSGFDMSLPFTAGVPYLSRSESKEAREKHARRMDKTAVADIQIKPGETESMAFCMRVRSEIDNWLSSNDPDTPDYVNIDKVPQASGDAPVQFAGSPSSEDLSRFEKRLIHQLVRAEYPNLVTISKRGFVQIVRFDKEREDKLAAQRTQELNERINRQKGFRWIIEALHGSDITGLDLKECAKDPVSGEPTFIDMDEFKAQFHRAQGFLRRNPRILVGHNCFLDFVYIYHRFIGPLPNTVEEFQREVHRLWPVVIDTKYMSTHNCGDINPVSSLEQIASQLNAERTPVLEVDPEHRKYAEKEKHHEAGYDSFLTAQIAVRLSAKLEREGTYIEVGDHSVHGDEDMITDGVNGVKITAPTPEEVETYSTSQSNPAPERFTESEVGFRWKRHGDPSLPPPHPNDPFVYNPEDLKHRYVDEDADKSFEGGMPSFASDFWRVYGNKLRVFGTEEGVCLLDGSKNPVGGEDLALKHGGVIVGRM